MRPALAVCAVAGAASLLLVPAAPGYDAWTWLVWGREIISLELDTDAGVSWKPLPVVFTAAFAPFDAAPTLWAAVVRAAGLAAPLLAGRVAARIAGWPAGIVAALALLASERWLRYLGASLSEPLVVAAMLAAVDRHLAARHGQALALGVVAALGRPELAGFVLLYAVLALRAKRVRVPAAAIAVAVVPVAWFGIDWLASGNPLLAGERALSDPIEAAHPGLVLIERAYGFVALPVQIAALLAVLFAIRHRDAVTLALAGGAAALVAGVAVMAEAGFSGTARYLVPPAALACVLAGVGASWAAAALTGGRPAARRVTAVALAVAAAAWALARVDLGAEVARTRGQAQAQRDAGAALAAAGARDAAPARGRPAVNANQGLRTLVAWELNLPIERVLRLEPPERVDAAGIGEPLIVLGTRRTRVCGGRATTVAQAGRWIVYAVAPARAGPATSCVRARSATRSRSSSLGSSS